MGRRLGLIDTNVLLAAAARGHEHHRPSIALLNRGEPGDFATSVHCLSEFYSIATRRIVQGADPMPPAVARGVLAAYRDNLELLSLDPDQHIDALSRFAAAKGAGPLVYDFIIGQVAVVHGIPAVITWNVRHFAALFPALRVVTPADFIEES